MPFLDFIRHAAWIACGVYGAICLCGSAAVILWHLFDAREKRKRPPPMSAAEFDTALEQMLRSGR